MSIENTWRRVRGAFGNAAAWGAGWSGIAFAVFAALRLAGVLPEAASWRYGFGLAARFGIVGFVAGGAFSSLIRLVYHGRRLRDINWVRFTIAGGVATGVFVPLFLQAMNLLSGDGLVPWRLVFDDGIWATLFGAAAAGGSLKLAQRVDAVTAAKSQDQLDPAETLERLPPIAEPDD